MIKNMCVLRRHYTFLSFLALTYVDWTLPKLQTIVKEMFFFPGISSLALYYSYIQGEHPAPKRQAKRDRDGLLYTHNVQSMLITSFVS